VGKFPLNSAASTPSNVKVLSGVKYQYFALTGHSILLNVLQPLNGSSVDKVLNVDPIGRRFCDMFNSATFCQPIAYIDPDSKFPTKLEPIHDFAFDMPIKGKANWAISSLNIHLCCLNIWIALDSVPESPQFCGLN
jgi:hypothetical protein